MRPLEVPVVTFDEVAQTVVEWENRLPYVGRLRDQRDYAFFADWFGSALILFGGTPSADALPDHVESLRAPFDEFGVDILAEAVSDDGKTFAMVLAASLDGAPAELVQPRWAHKRAAWRREIEITMRACDLAVEAGWFGGAV